MNTIINITQYLQLTTMKQEQPATQQQPAASNSQADKNKNGIIEYNEFIEWLQQPMATVRMGSRGLEYFDLEAGCCSTQQAATG